MLLLGRAVGISLPSHQLQIVPGVSICIRTECSLKSKFNVCIEFDDLLHIQWYRLEIRGKDDNNATSFCSRIFIVRDGIVVKLPVSVPHTSCFSRTSAVDLRY